MFCLNFLVDSLALSENPVAHGKDLHLTCIFWNKTADTHGNGATAFSDATALALGMESNAWHGSQIRRTRHQQQPNNVSNYLSPPRSPPKADRLPAVNPFHRCRDPHRWCRHVCICTGHGQQARAPSNWLAGRGSHAHTLIHPSAAGR